MCIWVTVTVLGQETLFITVLCVSLSLYLLGTSSDGERLAWMEAMKAAAAPKPTEEKK